MKIPENISLVLKAILPLFVIIILFFFTGKLGFTKISQIRNQIAESTKDRAVLTEKLDLLRTVAVTGVEDSNSVTSALPDSSPALAVVSQLKNQAAGSGLILSSIKAKVESNTTEDLKSVSIGFNIMGEKSSVETFLLNINTLAPITILNKTKLSELNGIYSGEVTVNSFWSPLPTQLPATIEGFADLTPEDKETLTAISSLTQPTFLNLVPVQTTGRENPFAE